MKHIKRNTWLMFVGATMTTVGAVGMGAGWALYVAGFALGFTAAQAALDYIDGT